MVAEQFVTAGTTTSRCVRTLIRRYKKLRSERQRRPADIESAHPQLGTLEIEYFQPFANRGTREPVQSHIKLTIVDAEWVVLGSGNLDRASWYTSQELGVAFHDTQLALRVAEIVGSKLSGRTRVVFDSGTS
jgi:phosphatidylserine/phosphatidylglycerophosphate/cardiolipin synthase-like enzyme